MACLCRLRTLKHIQIRTMRSQQGSVWLLLVAIWRTDADRVPTRYGPHSPPRWLEVEAQSKLYRSWVVHLRRQTIISGTKATRRAPITRVAKDQIWIGQLVMVEKVREDRCELNVETFRNHDALLNAKIHVPEGHTSQNPGASAI